MAQILLRIRTSNGTERITLSPSARFSELVKALSAKCTLPGESIFLYRDLKDKNPLGGLKTHNTLKSLKLCHGDMLYVKTRIEKMVTRSVEMDSPAVEEDLPPPELDQVDKLLAKDRGLIERPLNPQMCHHNDKGKCVHCSPLEPYDSDYLKEKEIKHMSFYSYIIQCTSGVSGKFVQLEDLDCKIKSGCDKHPPWPEGICTQCQPKAVTLNQQEYRHTDFIEFESPKIVERFISYWRETGHQRAGFLYGRYERETAVPLGIKSVVSFIYEPPQNTSPKSIEFLEDPYKSTIDAIAAKLGLTCVGWVFTDLQALSRSEGTVKNLRNAKSFFLTAQECIHAAHFQNLHPNPSTHSKSGKFGSKFSTVCVSGNAQNEIEMQAYQVSNQCMALVRDQILLPAKEHPGMAYVKVSSAEQYVPDVFFREEDEYKNTVTKEARPLPVEYLLLQLPTGTPKNGKQPLLPGGLVDPLFPIINRDMLPGHSIDLDAFKRYYRTQPDESFLETLSDINVLFFLMTNDTISFNAELDALCLAIKSEDRVAAIEFKESPTWATLEQILSMDTGGQMAQGGETWNCGVCTLINNGSNSTCEACGTPKG